MGEILQGWLIFWSRDRGSGGGSIPAYLEDPPEERKGRAREVGVPILPFGQRRVGDTPPPAARPAPPRRIVPRDKESFMSKGRRRSMRLPARSGGPGWAGLGCPAAMLLHDAPLGASIHSPGQARRGAAEDVGRRRRAAATPTWLDGGTGRVARGLAEHGAEGGWSAAVWRPGEALGLA